MLLPATTEGGLRMPKEIDREGVRRLVAGGERLKRCSSNETVHVDWHHVRRASAAPREEAAKRHEQPCQCNRDKCGVRLPA